FLDGNGNGRRDVGEPLVLTDASGRYALTGLTPGTYTVAVAPQPNYTRTLPASPAAYTVTIAADGTTVGGKDSGETIAFPDLAVQNVTVTPAAAGPGQSVTITWSVANQGNVAAGG